MLVAAAEAAMQEHGFGAGASRLIAGSLSPHRALEARIARWKGAESALLFNSGYQANLGMISALVGPEDVVFSDELNHASLIDGCRLSRARVIVYKHNDVDDLAQKIGVSARRRLVVTDSVFSMDGDRAPLAEIAALARAHDALLAVDDAHAIGVLGEDGVGLCDGLGVDLQMGTLGKALGGFGAYVAGAAPLVELLAQRARSFVFTTALPVPVVAAAHAAIDWLSSDPGRAARARLIRHTGWLHEHGFPRSHIVPVQIGDARSTMEISETLLARGIFAQGIRPPTVPPGTSRLRITLMATHTDEHLQLLLAALTRPGDPVDEPLREGQALRLASVYPDARLGGGRAAHHRPRRRQPAHRHRWPPLSRRRLVAVGEPARPPSSRARRRGARAARQDRALDAARPRQRAVHRAGGEAGPTRAARPEQGLLLRLGLDRRRGRAQDRLSVPTAARPHRANGNFSRFTNAYHGDTLGAVSVGGIDLFHQIFQPLLFHVEHVAPTIEAAARGAGARADELAAFIVEPLVQGAAGMLLQPTGFLAAARELCTQHDVLLICDEVATGFGRTGTMFACEQEQVSPDLLCLAKGITGGYLPLAATLATDEIYDAFLAGYGDKKTFFHGHTYTANPLACAAALASLEIFARERVLEQLPAKIERLRARLAERIAPLDHVLEIRQRGLMIGIELQRADRQPYAFEEAIGARVCLARAAARRDPAAARTGTRDDAAALDHRRRDRPVGRRHGGIDRGGLLT